MKKVMIVTDSNSGIRQSESLELGIKIVPMPFIINGQEYEEDISLNQEQFYELLKDENANISTSQPSLFVLETLFDEILKEYDEIVYIPMSSGLSASCASSKSLAKEKYEGKVFVVDNQRVSVTQKQSVYEAIGMVKLGKSALEIKSYLEETKAKSSIYIMIDTLKYLKKGGRVTAAGAALGAMLHIKPVMQIHGEKLDAFFKGITVKQSLNKMIQQVKYDLENDFKEEYEQGKMVISFAYTNNEEDAMKFKEYAMAQFPNVKCEFVDPLSLSISCHIGSGSLAIALSIKNY